MNVIKAGFRESPAPARQLEGEKCDRRLEAVGQALVGIRTAAGKGYCK